MANTFSTVGYGQEPFDELQGAPTVARYQQEDVFKGMIEGQGKMAAVALFNPDGSGRYTGMQRISGSVDGRTGSFVLAHEGIFAATGSVSGTWSVVPNSGTSDLIGLSGQGGFEYAPGDTDIAYTLTYRVGEGV